MESTIIAMCIPWVIEELASSAATVDVAGLKAKTAAAITAALPSKWLDAQLIPLSGQVIDAVYKLSQDQPDLVAVLKALAAKNSSAASAAMKAMITPYLPAALQTLLVAA